jgi:c-di-GMP-binding flagellar brake protein YcgR
MTPAVVAFPLAHRHIAEKRTLQRIERRLNRRYPVCLELQYKLLAAKARTTRTGFGRIVNISSGGVLFTGRDTLPAGSLLELSIRWPMLLDNCCPLKLAVRGRVLRSDEKGTAIKMGQYEFRTSAVRPVSAT